MTKNISVSFISAQQNDLCFTLYILFNSICHMLLLNELSDFLCLLIFHTKVSSALECAQSCAAVDGCTASMLIDGQCNMYRDYNCQANQVCFVV